jgi:hypothetical protein
MGRKDFRFLYQGSLNFWKVFGQLVLLGFDITAFTPAAYQRSSLLRPLNEISS